MWNTMMGTPTGTGSQPSRPPRKGMKLVSRRPGEHPTDNTTPREFHA